MDIVIELLKSLFLPIARFILDLFRVYIDTKKLFPEKPRNTQPETSKTELEQANERGVSLAKEYFYIENYSEAKNVLVEVLSRDNECYPALDLMVKVLIQLKEYEISLKYFVRLFKKARNLRIDHKLKFSETRQAYSMVLLELGQYEEAVVSCTKAIELNRYDTRSWYIQAKSLQELQEFEKAIKSYNEVLKFNPNNQEAKTNLNICKQKLSKSTVAKPPSTVFTPLAPTLKPPSKQKGYPNTSTPPSVQEKHKTEVFRYRIIPPSVQEKHKTEVFRYRIIPPSVQEKHKTEVVNLPVLKIGSYGGQVYRLKERLQKLGFFKGNILDGMFDSITQEAVRNAQRHYGLNPNGIVGSDTWTVLLK
ncbi:peptidoglycan-binding protein [Floridanema aerugineum]|uniref:Peptidoglycan-binding protein n=1 Tax=Floridaenema aerugineum BLCC-F46 TaxID=3153654 RepID=A0ABV4XJ32_9CYAN